MPRLLPQLEVDRCPHCGVDKPTLGQRHTFQTSDHSGGSTRHWIIYACSRCGGVVSAASQAEKGNVTEIYPSPTSISEAIPEPARSYLNQALESLHIPAGGVMLAASAVDAMLKAKAYKAGTLFERINKAAEDHLITAEMAQWAHSVRLDANEPRHADEQAPLPSPADARRSLDFALALGEFLFVLPSKVNRGITDAVAKSGGA